MTSSALQPLGSDFDRFLYAPVGADRHGGLLSVISALARLGVDPWEQAAMLARLPLDSAARTLSVLLAKLPAGAVEPADCMPVAEHLVSLLPRAAPLRRPAPAFAAAPELEPNPRPWLTPLFFMLFVLLLLGAKLLLDG